ncbi:hypothetical protein BDA96_09G071200 [Sorghum bicolor]|uniref:Uncharacterized protein n=1 Tax=Sorghum bicolor TaxID=4558 RepID=A0A921Q823_SORBI|nr:hypothetical protein BDA96_09G071200 [Sorghum bicolor]
MAPTLQIHRDPGHDDGARMAMATARHSISTVPMQRSALQHCTGHVCKIVNSNLNSEILTACRTYISWINSVKYIAAVHFFSFFGLHFGRLWVLCHDNT